MHRGNFAYSWKLSLWKYQPIRTEHSYKWAQAKQRNKHTQLLGWKLRRIAPETANRLWNYKITWKTNKWILSGVSFYTGDSRYYLTLKSFVYLLASFFLLCSSPNLRMLSKILKVIFNFLLPENRYHLAYLTQCTALTLSFGCFCLFEELFCKVYEGKETILDFLLVLHNPQNLSKPSISSHL